MATEGAGEMTASLLSQISVDVRVLGCEWWNSHTATVVRDLALAGDLIVAIAGIIDVLREGWDPDWVVGGVTVQAAFTVASEWIDAGVDAREVGDWYRCGCWEPGAARRLVGVGIHPDRLLNAARVPVHLVDEGPEGKIPVAQAVADNYITAEQAVRVVTRYGIN